MYSRDKNGMSPVRTWTEGRTLYEQGRYLRSEISSKEIHSQLIEREEPQSPFLKLFQNHRGSFEDQTYRAFNPQPSSPQWEKIQASWEQRLQEDGLEAIFRELKIKEPAKYFELLFGSRSLWFEPTLNDGLSFRRSSEALKADIPTMAFELTKQASRHPVSPVNGQRHLFSGQRSKGWGLQVSNNAKLFNDENALNNAQILDSLDAFLVQPELKSALKSKGPYLHFKQDPELADWMTYTESLTLNENSLNNRQLSRRVQFADFDDVRKRSSRDSRDSRLGKGLQNAFAAHPLKQNTTSKHNKRGLTLRGPAPRALILGHKAALYLNEFEYESFCDLAKALVTHEEEDMGYVHSVRRVKPRSRKVVSSSRESTNSTDTDEIPPTVEFVVDIKSERDMQSFRIIDRSKEGRQTYLQKVLPVLSLQQTHSSIRVRSIQLDCQFECTCVADSRELKVIAVDVGYLSVFARWNRPQDIESNSLIFEKSVLNCLYPRRKTMQSDIFAIDVPNIDETFYIDRSLHPMLTQTMQEVFGRLTGQDKSDGPMIDRESTHIYITQRRLSNTRVADNLLQKSPSQQSPGKSSRLKYNRFRS